MISNNFIAVDLGASSGRVIVSHDDQLDEIHRFKDYLKNKNGSLIWNIKFIFKNVILGLKKAVQKYKRIESCSIDSWGVDYVLLKGNRPLKPFYAYRDSRTKKTIEEVHSIIPFKHLYSITGIQFAEFNSIYQLKDDLNKKRLEKATDFLHIPEYLSFLLTGKKAKEYSMASTTGLLDLKTHEYSEEILDKLNFPKQLFPKLVKPGYVLGNLKEKVAKKIGANFPIIMCASHDTGSAYEAIDVDEETIILSSGTWSLFGVKILNGNNSDLSFENNFTNEGGVNYIRYLKNIMGMWIMNEVKKHHSYSFEEINSLVKESNYQEVFDVNDSSLLAPENMIEAINNLLKNNPPKTDGDLYRSIYFSLAVCYKNTCDQIEKCLSKKFKKICILGGGAKNALLNDIIKEITQKEIIATPIEATAIGNIKVQKGAKI